MLSDMHILGQANYIYSLASAPHMPLSHTTSSWCGLNLRGVAPSWGGVSTRRHGLLDLYYLTSITNYHPPTCTLRRWLMLKYECSLPSLLWFWPRPSESCKAVWYFGVGYLTWSLLSEHILSFLSTCNYFEFTTFVQFLCLHEYV